MIIRNLDVICIITCEIPYVGKEENKRNICFLRACGEISDMPSDPPFAGWARISNVKPADPLNTREKNSICREMQKHLKVMLLSAEYAC